MLYQFLAANRERILALTTKKAFALLGKLPATPESARGLPAYFDRLAAELEREAKRPRKHAARRRGVATARQGRELARLGYTVAQVVHSYGALCQAITELASAEKAAITAGEFGTLNLSLDNAIAQALEGFVEEAHSGGGGSRERIGFLVHELRNALSPALVAHAMVKKGVVGAGGGTNALLERNLNRMADLLDRSFFESRRRRGREADLQPVDLREVVADIESQVSAQARLRRLTLKTAAPPRLLVRADLASLVSALSNLVQNAIKYSKPGGTIWVRGRAEDHEAVIEVEDHCGGLPAGKAEELFQPFVQKGSDRSGLGLGLAISRQAVELNGGRLIVHDLPGKGCVFTLSLPRSAAGGSHAQKVSHR